MLAELRRHPPPGIDASELAGILDAAAAKTWAVYAKPPFGGPAQVLRYLARYTHKIAISDRRIVEMDERGVAFNYKDCRNGIECKVMRLGADEWLRRFVTHVLPRGFVRLRSYGFLANTRKRENLVMIRALLGACAPTLAQSTLEPERTACLCPVCGRGALADCRPLSRRNDTS